ncbi:MAG: HD domain-containing protein [Chlamydiales bacterium]|nr:HD domain-containing protein [Chlamydiia bacterium]MCP5507624.1 HD domain-containing protein [Chlamydiales bacterium]
MNDLKAQLLAHLAQQPCDDASHDINHALRVCELAVRIGKEEAVDADLLVITAAALLHDLITLPKDHPERHKSSWLSALGAGNILRKMDFSEDAISAIEHAIHAHSFSANVETRTLEARCVQDADRMEALGAWGVMRTFYTAGRMGGEILDANDPRGEHRMLDDRKFALDHFPLKLFTLYSTMKTDTGKKIAKKRAEYLEEFRERLCCEYIDLDSPSMAIAVLCYDAGRERSLLFNPENPFEDDSNNLPVSQLIKKSSSCAFTGCFLDRLWEELYPSLPSRRESCFAGSCFVEED